MKLSLSRGLCRHSRGTIVLLILAALASLAFAQAPAPQNQIDLGGGYYGTDLTGVYSNFQNGTTTGQSAKYSPSANWNGKYTYSLPLDSANTLKFALGDDGWYGFYTGNVANQAVESGQNTGVITPLVEYLGFGADITLSAPIYYYNPADAGGYSEMKYAYKESGYLPVGPKTTTGTNPLDSADSVIPTINLKAFYKYSFDKTTWISGGVGVLYAVSPTPWLTDVLPKVSAGAYGVQVDVQYDYYNGYNGGAAGTTQYYDTYLEPKLTYDLGFLKLVPGLKLYGQARISLSTTNPNYTSGIGSGDPFHDTYIQPGLNYSISVPKVGSFAIDAGWRFTKVDNVGTFSGLDNGKYANNVAGNANVNDVVPFSDLRIAVSYSYKF
jgi:hypothetical protein